MNALLGRLQQAVLQENPPRFQTSITKQGRPYHHVITGAAVVDTAPANQPGANCASRIVHMMCEFGRDTPGHDEQGA